MTDLLVEDADGIEASDAEILRGGESYMIDTVSDMRQQGHEKTLFVGADVDDGLETWERSDQLRQLVRVAVVDRPGYVSSTPDGWLMERVAVEPKEISSSKLRDQMSEGVAIYDSLSASVRSYIDDHQLQWASHDK